MWIVFATTLVNRAGMMALPFLVLYLTKHLGVSAPRAGLAVAAYGMGSFVVAPLAGRLSDRIGPFQVFRASLALTGVVLFVIPMLHAYESILVATFAWGVAADAARPATMTALTGAVGPEKRQAAIAVNRLAMNIGSSIGPAVGGFLAVFSFPLVFMVDAITSIIAAAALSVMLHRHRRSMRDAERAVEESFHATSDVPRHASVWRDPRAMALVAAAFLVNFVYTQDIGSLPLHVVRNLHFSTAFFGSLFLVNTLIIIVIEVPLNLAMGHWPAWRGSAIAALLIATGYGALIFVHDALPIVMTVVIWTFGEMIFFPASVTSMAELADGRRTGEYMGALSAAFSLAIVAGPWAGSTLLARVGPDTTWVVMFGVGVAAAILIVFTRGHAATR